MKEFTPTTKTTQKFALNLRFLLKYYHLKQKTLAAKLGVAEQTVSSWACGTKLPSASNIDRLAQLFRLDIWKLFY